MQHTSSCFYRYKQKKIIISKNFKILELSKYNRKYLIRKICRMQLESYFQDEIVDNKNKVA